MSDPDSRAARELLRQSLGEGKQPYVTVATNSMLPLLRRGDRIRLTNASVDELRPGDIVVIETPSDLVVHRYWGFRQERGGTVLLTRGDRLLRFDPSVSAADLVGRVTLRGRENRQLDLTGGVGGWLNRRLVDVAALEATLLAVSPEQGAERAHDNIARAADDPSALLTRMAHKVFYGISITITLLVNALGQKRPGE